MFRCLILATLLAVATARRAHDSGSLVVVSPKSLADLYKDGIQQSPAMFGIPAHGHQAELTGRVVYVPSDDIEGCEPINKAELPPMYDKGLVIMVVERGNCTFVTKVKHAQEVGASGCIIVDNKEEPGLPYMADDGHGSLISIPSMLVHMDDGAKIQEAVSKGMVRLQMAWNIPHPDNIVEWQVWTSSDDTVATALKTEIRKFKTDFDSAAKVLGNSAVMTPHYFIGNGQWAGCLQPDDSQPLPCDTACTNQGRYCSLNARGDANSGLTGAQVVEENLRQICIFKELNKTSSTVNWWNYVEDFMNQCTDYSKECAERVMSNASVGVDPAAVNQCMDSSGGVGARSGNNTLLEEEMSLRADLGVWSEPTILINEVTYRGSLTCPLPIDVTHCGVLATICAGFLDMQSIPACASSPGCPLGQTKDLCGKCGGNGQIDACGQCLQLGNKMFNASCLGCDNVANSGRTMDNCGVCGGEGPDKCNTCHYPDTEDGEWIYDKTKCPIPVATGLSPAVTATIVIVLLLVLAFGVFAYVRYRQRLFRDDVDALLAQYLPMGDGVGQVAKGGAIQTSA